MIVIGDREQLVQAGEAPIAMTASLKADGGDAGEAYGAGVGVEAGERAIATATAIGAPSRPAEAGDVILDAEAARFIGAGIEIKAGGAAADFGAGIELGITTDGTILATANELGFEAGAHARIVERLRDVGCDLLAEGAGIAGIIVGLEAIIKVITAIGAAKGAGEFGDIAAIETEISAEAGLGEQVGAIGVAIFVDIVGADAAERAPEQAQIPRVGVAAGSGELLREQGRIGN